MNDGQALRAAVVADPDDDAVRLVCADWLEESGDATRAEFIRTQIEQEGLKKRSPRRPVLEARARELAARHARDWLRYLPEWAVPREDDLIADDTEWFGFRRGFLQGVIFPELDIFLAEAPAAFAVEPITHLYLADSNALPRLATCPEFLALAGIRFSHYAL
ncbi:MAG: TIGR02996 domain-containing protein, partial [Gemmataceae bacterium]